MLEQVAMGRKGDRGFKDETYMAVGNTMATASMVGKKFTEGTIKDICKTLRSSTISIRNSSIPLTSALVMQRSA